MLQTMPKWPRVKKCVSTTLNLAKMNNAVSFTQRPQERQRIENRRNRLSIMEEMPKRGLFE